MIALKLSLLSFLEQKGAYNAAGRARLPGGQWADLNEFLTQSGVDARQLEELLQQMRASWQLAALWFNKRGLAFYTPLGHEELNRLRGSDSPPPASAPAMDENMFWLSLHEQLKQRGEAETAALVAGLHARPAVLRATRDILRRKYI